MIPSLGRLSLYCALVLTVSYSFGNELPARVPFGGSQDDLSHTKDSVETIQENLESKKAVLVDVREIAEWNAGHLKGAKLVPWSKLRFASPRKKLNELPDDGKIIYCYCKVGVRALKAGKKLQQLGYDVRPIKAGYKELVSQGFEKSK